MLLTGPASVCHQCSSSADLYSTRTRRCEHVTSLLSQLHSLRVPEAIEFKLCTLLYKCRPISGWSDRLGYLVDDLQRVADVQSRQHLHSASSPALIVPTTTCRVTIGSRAFPAFVFARRQHRYRQKFEISDRFSLSKEPTLRLYLKFNPRSCIYVLVNTSNCHGRAFPVAAARAWNALPQSVTSAPSVAVFRKSLNTHLYQRSYQL